MVAAKLDRVIELLADGAFTQPERVYETPIVLGNSGNSQISRTERASPKRDFAIEWLRQHPEHRGLTGRDLEVTVTMNGETISYKYWNEAKKLV